MGCPIRKSTDQSLFAAPHGLSQGITSFIACACQGIHQMPLRHLIVLIANVHHFPFCSRRIAVGRSACARRAARAATAVRPCEACASFGVPSVIVVDRTARPPEGGKRHEKRETNIVASFSSGRCKHRPACNGCRRPAASSCQPRSQERSKLTKDQLPETGPDGCGQANQSVIHDARRHREPGMAQGVNPKGDEPSGTLPRTGSHRT